MHPTPTLEQLQAQLFELRLKQRAGQLPDALPILHKQVEIDAAAWADHADMAIPHEKIAALLLDQNARLDEAQQHAQQALAIRGRHQPPTHPDISDTLRLLAEISRRRQDLPVARLAYQELVHIALATAGVHSLEYARETNNLGDIDFAQGQFAQARDRYERSVAAIRNAAGESYTGYWTTLNSLAHACFRSGQLQRAEALYARLFTQRLETYPTDAPEFHSALSDWIDFYQQTGASQKIPALYRRVIAAQSHRFGAAAPQALFWVNQLARFYLEAKDYAQAAPLQAQVLEAVRKIGDPAQAPDQLAPSSAPENAAALAAALDGLAYSYVQLGRLTEALALYCQSLALWENLLADDDPLGLSDRLYQAGSALREAGRPHEARGYLERGLALRRSMVDRTEDRSPQTCQMLTGLALTFRDLGDTLAAEVLLLEACQLADAPDVPPHPAYPAALVSLGQFYAATGKFPKAEGYLQRGLEAQRRLSGRHSPEAAHTCAALGTCYRQTGRLAQALHMRRRVLHIRHVLRIQQPPHFRPPAAAPAQRTMHPHPTGLRRRRE